MTSDSPDQRPSKTVGSAPLKVLMIEDNPMDAMLIEQMLAQSGAHEFTVLRAETMAAGLEGVAKNDIDLVLCDLSLPDSEGLNSFVQVHARASHLPIIILTGTNDERIAVEAVHRGAQDYLVKQQVDASLLVRAIRYALERKHIETALQYERDLMQTLQDNVPARIYFKDEQSRFLRVNRGWAALFDLRDPSDAVGKTDFDFFTEEHARQAFEDELRVMRTGQAILNLVEKETFPDRPPTWVLTSKLPMRDKTGRIIGTFGISSDITPLKVAEEQLKQANAELQETNEKLKTTQLYLIQAEKMQSVGRLAAGVAHEVKNPLATLQMCVDYVNSATDSSDQELRQVLKEMKDAINRADSIIRGLVDFSAQRDLEIKEHEVSAVIEEALRLLTHELGKGIRVVKELQPGLPPVPMDAEKFVQVLVNIITNAIHAMSGSGELRIRTQVRRMRPEDLPRDAGTRQAERIHVGEDAMVIELSDTGGGIPTDKLDKLFDPFFTTKPTGKGTGLGLTVTKKIVEMHGGLIQIANQEPRGAKVTITLGL